MQLHENYGKSSRVKSEDLSQSHKPLSIKVMLVDVRKELKLIALPIWKEINWMIFASCANT